MHTCDKLSNRKIIRPLLIVQNYAYYFRSTNLLFKDKEAVLLFLKLILSNDKIRNLNELARLIPEGSS